MSIIRNLMVRAGADFSALQRAMQRMTGSMRNFERNMAGAMAGVTAALGSIAFGFAFGEAVKEAIKVEGAILNLNRLMGNNAQSFLNWANSSAQAFGMSRAEAIDFGRTYANLISSFATTTGETMVYTQDLLKASAVVASMSGRTMTDVMDRIRSGMLGNTEAIEDLGINVGIAMIESTDAFKKFANGKSWAQLSFQTQQQIRFFAILEQASKKFGTELADTTGTKLLQFQAALGNVKLAFGEAFMPILNAALPTLTRLIQTLASAITYISMFVRALFGISNKQTKPIQNQAKAVGGVTSAMEDTTDATKEAQKAQKGFLAGFDEINSVPDKAESAADAMSAMTPTASVGATDIPVQTEDPFAPVAENAAKMAAKVKATFFDLSDQLKKHKDIIIAALAGISAGIISYTLVANGATIATKLWNAAMLFTTKIMQGIRAAMLFLISPAFLIAAAIAVVVAAFVYLYKTNDTFKEKVDAAFTRAKEIITDLWNNVLVPLGKYLADEFLVVWENVKIALIYLWNNVLVPLGAFLADSFVKSWDAIKIAAQNLYQNVLKPLGKWLMEFYNTVIKPLALLLKDVLGVAFKFVADIALMFWKQVLIPLGKALLEILKPAFDALVAVLKVLWQYVLVPFMKFVSEFVMVTFQVLTKVLTVLWQEVLKPLSAFIGGVLRIVFQNAFEAIGGVINGLKTTIIGMLNFITGVFTGDWRKAWEGVRDIFGGIFNSLVSLAKTPFNIIIDMINKVIEGINSMGFKLPEWMGGSEFNLSIPKIKRLADGGILNNPTLAMVGEAGSEMVVPLENTSFTDKVASALGSAVMSAMQFTGSSNPTQNKDLVINIDGAAIAKAINPYLQRESVRVGSSLITVK